MKYKNKGEIISFVRQKDYEWERHLGEGGFGKTALIKDPVINEYFVCKKYEPQPLVDKYDYYENLKNEIKIMHKLFHENIARVFSYYLYPSQTTGFILMDFIEGTDIASYISSCPENINSVFAQTIEAFTYLEANNILHRDIRPKNILVTKERIVKIIDFGFGKQIFTEDDFDKSISLNWLYEKPDDFEKSIYNFKTEIYFVGKLFEGIIRDYNINGFKYNDTLRKMIAKSPDERISSFEKIRENILNDSYVFDEYFDYQDKKHFQCFMEQVINVFSEIGSSPNYFSNIDQLAEVSVDNLKYFIQFIKNSNKEKKNIIKLCIINRLRTIKQIDEPTYDIPF